MDWGGGKEGGMEGVWPMEEDLKNKLHVEGTTYTHTYMKYTYIQTSQLLD